MLNQIKNLKLVKSDLTCAKLVNSVQFYELTKFVIWIKSGLNLTLKLMLTCFVRLSISFKLYIG